MQVTVTGGTGAPVVPLTYAADDLAHTTAVALAKTIDATYTSAVYYDPANPGTLPHSGYLIAPDSTDGSVIDAREYSAVAVQDNSGPTTVLGGGNTAGQIVLAGDGGLSFRSVARGSTTVVAGGGNNSITFAANAGDDAIYTSTGNDTIIGGNGNTTIAAGGGDNKITDNGGKTLNIVTGHDNIYMTTGDDTVNVSTGGSAFVQGEHGRHVYSGSGFSLVFQGSDQSSTVNGGAGRFSIDGGSGGGFFRGGHAGGNYINGGSGSVTILGEGNNDTLIAGSGSNDVIRASIGNETLTGSTGGPTEFQFYDHHVYQIAGSVDHVTNFASADVFKLIGDHTAVAYALSTYQVTNGSGSFLLEDGTKVTLDGYSGALTANNFK